MAAGEDQAEAIVLDAFRVGPRRGIDSGDLRVRAGLVERVEPRLPSQAVDRLEAAGRNEPGAWVRRHAVARPLLERRPERVVERLLGGIEVADQSDERG